MPTAPLRMDSKKTVVGGSFWNFWIALSRCLSAIEPVIEQ